VPPLAADRRSRTLGALEKVRSDAAPIARAGSAAPAFAPWQRRVRALLKRTFGEESSYFEEFCAIDFETTELVEKLAKTARKRTRIVERGINPKLIRMLPLEIDISHAQQQQFRRAIDRASEILQAAIIEYRRT
jgi:hypothetical protein